jgi:hypothetical protein
MPTQKVTPELQDYRFCAFASMPLTSSNVGKSKAAQEKVSCVRQHFLSHLWRW